MKNTFFLCLIIWAMITCASNSRAQESTYSFDHGPYLQGLSTNKVYIYFSTSGRGISHVELRRANNETITKYYTIEDGIYYSNEKKNAIRIPNLLPDTEYEYRLLSTEIVSHRPYRAVLGDSIVSDWYRFRTLNPKADSMTFIVTSDIHDDSAKYNRLLSYLPVEKADMVFLLGDIMTYFHKEDQPYTSFIDISVDRFATHTPFVIVRGNHETRGHLALHLDDYVLKPDNHYYHLYRVGDTAIVMLDSGEDKHDSHQDYAGLNAFDHYRIEQAEWLKKIIKTEEYTSAAHRIIMIHIPPMTPKRELREGEEPRPPRASSYGPTRVNELFVPIFNEANADLVISGHTHYHYIIEKEEGVNNFPLLTNDNKSASLITVDKDGIHVKTVNDQGETTLDRKF